MSTELIAVEPPSTAAPAKRRGRWFMWLVWLYAIVAVICWLAVRYEGDRLWPATVMLFAPRWPMLLPLILLVPLGLIIYPRSFWMLCAVALLIAWPIMGLRFSRLPRTSDPPRHDLRVLTLNTHFAALDFKAMRALIELERPDVISLQEWFGGNADSIIGGNPDYRYSLSLSEAFFASRYPFHLLRDSTIDGRPGECVFCIYQIDYSGRPIIFYNIHLSSPHGSLIETLRGEPYGVNRLRNNAEVRWNEALHLRDLASKSGSEVLLAGDFNLPSDSPIFRSAFEDLGDAFSDAGFGYGWTYRTRRTDIRIDHILSGPAWSCRTAWVGPYVGSPHRPLLADYTLAAK